MFDLKIFRGTPSQFGVCASQRGSVSSARKNLRGHTPIGPNFSIPKKSAMCAYNFFVVDKVH